MIISNFSATHTIIRSTTFLLGHKIPPATPLPELLPVEGYDPFPACQIKISGLQNSGPSRNVRPARFGERRCVSIPILFGLAFISRVTVRDCTSTRPHGKGQSVRTERPPLPTKLVAKLRREGRIGFVEKPHREATPIGVGRACNAPNLRLNVVEWTGVVNLRRPHVAAKPPLGIRP